MEIITIADVLRATRGRLLYGDAGREIRGVVIDSHTVQLGDLFVAIPGERFDGHDFVAAAFEAQATAAIVTRELAVGIPQIVVPDSVKALQHLAAWYRQQMPATVIGITGSHGKSTCKEILAHLLAPSLPLHRTPKNLNGQIGLPLALLGLERRHRVMVLEMGISAIGEMDALTAMAQPQVGVLLNVAPAHTEFFGSLETILHEKSKLLRSLNGERISIINADDPLVAGLKQQLGGTVVTFGMEREADFRGAGTIVTPQGTSFVLTGPGLNLPLVLPMHGRHHVYNALAAVAAARLFGLSAEQLSERLPQFRPLEMRMNVTQRGNVWLIDDAYNAAPLSTRAALLTLAEFPAPGRRIAVLGDMLELGERSPAEHQAIGEYAANLALDYLLCYGPLSQLTARAAVEQGIAAEQVVHFAAQADLMNFLKGLLQEPAVVLVKGSRGMKMEAVIAACF